MAQKALTAEQRRAILEQQVLTYQRQGYVVQERTDSTANMERIAKKRGCIERFTWGPFLPRDKRLFLRVGENGRVERKVFKG